MRAVLHNEADRVDKIKLLYKKEGRCREEYGHLGDYKTIIFKLLQCFHFSDTIKPQTGWHTSENTEALFHMEFPRSGAG